MGEVLRFAPSPTGYLHVGGARTALYNWLLARKLKGRFLLRIEDTDLARSTEASIQQILNSLKWLGLDWDGQVYYQSRHQDRHCRVADQLLENGRAYRCFCTKEELAEKRKIAEQNKINQRYGGTCRNLSEAEIEQRLADGHAFAVRLKVPQGITTFDDLIHGSTSINNDTLDDFIIMRSDQTPVYQLAVVVDDHDMGVTRIIRGDDHIANTNKQILLYQAMNWDVPVFGHLPLILGPDKKRLSKRHGAASVEEFSEQGILPEALVNYLCLLGWSPGDDSEIMNRQEILERFDDARINKSSAVFDQKKLFWFNGKYIAQMEKPQVKVIVTDWLKKSGYKIDEAEQPQFELLAELQKLRATTLAEFGASLDLYFKDPQEYEAKGLKKFFAKPGTKELLINLKEVLAGKPDDWYNSLDRIEETIRLFAGEQNVAAAKVIHPLRLALTGKTTSPGIFELIYVFGKQKILNRLKNAIDYMDKTD